MNPNELQSVTPRAMLAHLWRYRELAMSLARRDVAGRYKGSFLGLAWSFFIPVIMLTIYTFVFTVVFKAKWGVSHDGGQGAFALQMFTGMIVHGLIAEVLTRSPTLILAHTNYVKKVVFPLAVLPLVPIGSALFHAGISLIVLLLGELVITGQIPLTVWMAPIVLLPFVVLVAGVGWLLASLGVFLRDIGQTTALLTTVLLFLSPVFYPLSALPESLRPFIQANPLTFIIEQMRQVLLAGTQPDWAGLLLYLLVALLVAWGGYAWFQKTRKGFADVL